MRHNFALHLWYMESTVYPRDTQQFTHQLAIVVLIIPHGINFLSLSLSILVYGSSVSGDGSKFWIVGVPIPGKKSLSPMLRMPYAHYRQQHNYVDHFWVYKQRSQQKKYVVWTHKRAIRVPYESRSNHITETKIVIIKLNKINLNPCGPYGIRKK